MSTSAGTWMRCGYCGKPVVQGVPIGGSLFHLECTQGPQPAPQYAPPTFRGVGAQPARYLTEPEVRAIVRDEIAKSKGTP